VELNRWLAGLRATPHSGPIAAALLMLGVSSAVSLMARSVPDDGSTIDAGPRVSAPAGHRIKVQVLNASTTPGLAARAVRYLRDRGFDVVLSGTSSVKSDSTVVLDRSGKGDHARLVALAFGVSRPQVQLDSTLLVDVTVRVGADWTPPANPFNP
jgi:hypothetical protein